MNSPPRPEPGDRIVTGYIRHPRTFRSAVVVAVVDDPHVGEWVALVRWWRRRKRYWQFDAVTEFDWTPLGGSGFGIWRPWSARKLR